MKTATNNELATAANIAFAAATEATDVPVIFAERMAEFHAATNELTARGLELWEVVELCGEAA